jgi:hypothetical protein
VAVCAAVAQSPITVVPAGRAVGKSFSLAGLVLWWVYTRPKSLVMTTGPDFRPVFSVLWKEPRRTLLSAPVPLGYDHLIRCYSTPKRLTVQHGTDWGTMGFAAQYEEGFSGQQRATCW